MKIKIITDSTSDIREERARELGVEVLPLSVTFGNITYMDGVELTKKEFYHLQLASEELPITSQINPEGFISVFEKCKKEKTQLIYISISSKLSGTMQSAHIAKEMCGYDGIHLFDSQNVTVGELSFVEVACQLRDRGFTVEEILEKLSAMVNKVRLYAIVDSFKYLMKGGRVSKSIGTIGGMLGLKPILTLSDGEISACGKGRGTLQSYKEIAKKLLNLDIDYDKPIFMAHSNNEALAMDLYEFLQNEGIHFPYRAEEIGCTVGTHAGPNCVGVVCVEK